MAHALLDAVVYPVWRAAQDVLIHRCRYCLFHYIQHPFKAIIVTFQCSIPDAGIHFGFQHRKLILQIGSLQFHYAASDGFSGEIINAAFFQILIVLGKGGQRRLVKAVYLCRLTVCFIKRLNIHLFMVS